MWILLLYIFVENVDIAYMLICECGILLLYISVEMMIELICISVEKGKMKSNWDL